MIRRYLVIPLLTSFLLLVIFVHSSYAWYDAFHNHPDNNMSLPEPLFGSIWMDNYKRSYIERIDTDNFVLALKCFDGYYEVVYATPKLNAPTVCSNYWAFRVYPFGSCPDDNQLPDYRIRFYNSSGGLIDEGGSNFLRNLFNSYHNGDQYELLRSGNTIAVYLNGTYMGDLGGVWNEMPCNIEFVAKKRSRGYYDQKRLRLDDISTTGDVISTFPQSWFILRNWDNPDANGLYEEDGTTRVSTHTFNVRYMWRNVTSYSERNPPCDKIIIKYFTTGEIVNQTSIPPQSFGKITYNFTEMLFHDDPIEDKYGLYEIDLMRGSDVVAQDFFFFTYVSAQKTSSGTISWEKDSYASGEIARIHTNITNPDFTTYLYKGYVYDIYGNKKEEWTVASADEWHEVDLNGYDAGVYYAILKIRNKNTGFEWEEAWDTTSVSEEVRIEGVSYDAKSETVLGGVYVNAIQNYEDHNTTTDATTGEYNISGLTVDMEIQMNASKINYTHNNFSFTPLQNGLYEINLYLLPDASHINITPPAVVGIVSEYPLHQALSNATVNIWKDGWNSNTTTNSIGYFEFILDNTSMETSIIENETFNSSEYDTWVQLANTGIVPYTEKVTNTTDETPYVRGVDYEMDYVNGEIKVLSTGSMQNNTLYHIDYEKYEATTFSLSATKEGYKESEVYTFTVNPTEIEYVYPLLYGLYNITVRARDASTHATIFNFKATLNDGEQIKETTVGWLNFTGVEYGIHKMEVAADGYYSAIEYVYVYRDVEKIVYLTPLETAGEQGVGISYPPHQVEFACVDMFGNPLANIQVEATPISTTTGAWDWLLNLFGIRNESISYYTNQTLNGTTDSRGAITFVMMENIEYEVRFVNESLGIDKTIRIYPKADHYTVILTPVTSSIVSSEDYITFNLSYEIVDEEEINLSLVYNDSLAQTQNLTFFVYNSTTLLYQQNFTNISNVSVSYTVPYKAGEEYMWGYSAFHSRFGEMGRSRILRIAWFLDLGISRAYCTWIAIAIILFLTAMFSFTTVKFGYVTIPMVSLIFAYIGWLSNISIIIIALCLGILAYMSKREKEVGV